GELRAAVAGVHVPQSREAVEVLVAVRVDDRRAVAAHEDQRAGVIAGMMQRMNQVIAIHPDELRGRHESPPRATSLVSMYSSRPSAPASRPSPLSFQPTNWASTACGVHSFTPTIPNSNRSEARIAVRRSFVHT